MKRAKALPAVAHYHGTADGRICKLVVLDKAKDYSEYMELGTYFCVQLSSRADVGRPHSKKVKPSRYMAMFEVGRGGCIAPTHSQPRPFLHYTTGKGSRYQLDRRLGGPQARS